jgi:energy-coupling factor transporter ATP-binding protein EcfA2
MTHVEPTPLPEPQKAMVPPVPGTVEETDLEFGFLADLALKTVYADANCTTERVAEKLRLPMPVTDNCLVHLYREKFIEIRGTEGVGNRRYGMLDRGWERAHRLLDMSGYIGPAPVSLNAYTAMSQAQEEVRPALKPGAVRGALGHLVLPERTLRALGLVVSSRRSLFMTGPPGSGKTSIAKSLHGALRGDYWIPYALEVDGQVIKMFDSHNHEPVPTADLGPHDRRWLRIKRPLVIVGGELTIETMDLVYSQTVRFYEASFQMKANGGTLVIDDFGRQRVDPRDLLNRWIIPLEGRVDYLTLHTGKKIQVPFEQMLIFATNLNPADLVDDAFLRRMGYRLRVEPPTAETYALIFQRYVEGQRLRYDPRLVELLLGWYGREQRPMSACEPRDLVERCLDICRYENRALALTAELLEVAWANYFGSPPV